MQDSLFIFGTIFVVTALIYFLYKVMLTSERSDTEEELQITSSEILQQLRLLYNEKKYNIVESLAKKYLDKKKNDDEVRTILAKAYNASGRVYDAIEQAEYMTSQNPKNIKVKIFLANCYLSVENQLKAINVYTSILDEFPDNIPVLKQLAQVYFNTNQKISAMKTYAKLAELVDNNLEKIEIMALIGDIHAEFNEFDQAIQQYEQIIEIYPDKIEAKKRLIELYKNVSDYDALITQADDIINNDRNCEDSLWAMKILLEVYNATHDYDKALDLAEQIKNHPFSDKTEIGIDMAKILLEKNQPEDSILMLESLIKQNPQNLELQKQMAIAYEAKKDFETAVLVYKRILDEAEIREVKAIHSELSLLYSNWAMYLFSQNDTDHCFKNFIIALQYDSENPEIYFHIGNVNMEIKNYNEAINNFKKCLDLDKKNIDCYYELAECYKEIGSVYEQKRILIESLEYVSDNPIVHYDLGLILQTQNDIDAAISHLKKAIDLNRNYTEAMYNLALLYEHIGNREEALRLYREILMIEPNNEDVINNLRMLNS